MDALLVCPECGHEWNAVSESEETAEAVIKDAVGNILQDGDTVSVTLDEGNDRLAVGRANG